MDALAWTSQGGERAGEVCSDAMPLLRSSSGELEKSIKALLLIGNPNVL
jgi:hypothetical protein